MPHAVYYSESFILGSRPFGEANKLLHLFTKEFGSIVASAQGLRADTSKLRYALQDTGKARVSLVRGKHTWKVTGADHIESYWVLWREDRQKLALVRRVAALLTRLTPGEEKNEELFSIMELLFQTLKDALTMAELEVVESVAVGRILRVLGYLPEGVSYQAVLVDNNAFVRTLPPSTKRLLIVDINAALQHSQL